MRVELFDPNNNKTIVSYNTKELPQAGDIVASGPSSLWTVLFRMFAARDNSVVKIAVKQLIEQKNIEKVEEAG